MNLKNCPDCGKLFVDNASGMCPDCYRLEEEAEYKIGEYLRKNDKVTIQQIHEETGVKEKTILRMIKRGRIVTGTVGYPCDSCGAPIYEGRMCSACTQSFTSQVKESYNKDQRAAANRDGIRMYSKEKEGK